MFNFPLSHLVLCNDCVPQSLRAPVQTIRLVVFNPESVQLREWRTPIAQVRAEFARAPVRYSIGRASHGLGVKQESLEAP